MISEYYKKFKVKDYMEEIKISKKSLDCSLGTNPFINKGTIKKCINKSKSVINRYPLNEYELLKQKLVDFYHFNPNIELENIAFGSWHNGNN